MLCYNQLSYVATGRNYCGELLNRHFCRIGIFKSRQVIPQPSLAIPRLPGLPLHRRNTGIPRTRSSIVKTLDAPHVGPIQHFQTPRRLCTQASRIGSNTNSSQVQPIRVPTGLNRDVSNYVTVAVTFTPKLQQFHARIIQIEVDPSDVVCEFVCSRTKQQRILRRQAELISESFSLSIQR